MSSVSFTCSHSESIRSYELPLLSNKMDALSDVNERIGQITSKTKEPFYIRFRETIFSMKDKVFAVITNFQKIAYLTGVLLKLLVVVAVLLALLVDLALYGAFLLHSKLCK